MSKFGAYICGNTKSSCCCSVAMLPGHIHIQNRGRWRQSEQNNYISFKNSKTKHGQKYAVSFISTGLDSFVKVNLCFLDYKLILCLHFSLRLLTTGKLNT